MTGKRAALHRKGSERVTTDAGFTPHSNALEFAELGESIDADNSRDCETSDGDTAEPEVGFFDEVFQVHSVETGVKGACGKAEGSDAEFKIKEHEGVTVCIKDCFDTVARC